MIATLIFIFILAAFLGFELISKVPSQLHTPLMSGSNAISGITIVGAIVASRDVQASPKGSGGWSVEPGPQDSSRAPGGSE